ncbi:MAG: ATP synthase F1 subunit gamma [Candidatus Gracilibacteria bacterium]|jgi:F-type H+-transporting ATPase subunit gamma|nr:ATP synthase F1 subunit gamma [Candidatus Gracilibacteria bacterium]
MSNSIKDIRRKLKSIKSTRQITKAMELVATSKMKKATDFAIRLRNYGYLAFSLISSLSANGKVKSDLFEIRPVNNVLVLLFTTDKGLCGGLNANLFKKIAKLKAGVISSHPDAKFTFVASGKKGADFLRRVGEKIDFIFPAFTNNPKIRDIFPMTKIAMDGFLNGSFDKVLLVYPDFVSLIQQKPVVKTLLPFSTGVFAEMLSELGSKFSSVAHLPEKKLTYKLEPDSNFILNNIIPQLLESQIYQAVLETSASEHSARMVAMQNATSAASDLLDNLTLTYNQARQAAITQEIAEIAASSLTL